MFAVEAFNAHPHLAFLCFWTHLFGPFPQDKAMWLVLANKLWVEGCCYFWLEHLSASILFLCSWMVKQVPRKSLHQSGSQNNHEDRLCCSPSNIQHIQRINFSCFLLLKFGGCLLPQHNLTYSDCFNVLLPVQILHLSMDCESERVGVEA